MKKEIERPLRKIIEILIKMLVIWMVDSIALWSSVNLFLVAFSISFRLTLDQAFSIIVLLFILPGIFFNWKEERK
jgi:hypothetical protein